MVVGFQSNAPPRSNIHDAQRGAKSKRNLNRALDIVFLQDTTGSQGPYIRAARQAIGGICDKISAASEIPKGQLRFGLIAFRDHPPQDFTYVTKQFGFTSDIAVMQKNLSSLVASGGGDGPEAQTAALAASLDLDWAEGAIKMVVLITDSPPHGLGEEGDGFSKSPDQNDPLELARQMSEKGITLFVIACEPALSSWMHAVDFYTALSRITSGRMFPLLMANKLGDFIVGTALETIDTEKLIEEFEQKIVEDVYENDTPVRQVVSNLQEYIQSNGTVMNRVVMEDVYCPSSVAQRNVDTWLMSKDVGTGSSNVFGMCTVRESRLKPQHLVGYSATGSKFRASSTLRDFRRRKERSASPPAPSIMRGSVTSSVAHRVVMQSMARNSDSVTSNGMSSNSGKLISNSEIYYHTLDTEQLRH